MWVFSCWLPGFGLRLFWWAVVCCGAGFGVVEFVVLI